MSVIGNILHKGAVALGYDAAISTRKRRDLPSGRRVGRDEDSLIGRTDRNMLRQKCLDLRRNDSIVAGVVQRFADNVVGSGILPQAKTADDGWNKESEQFWGEWSKIADSRGRLHLSQMQKMSVQMRLLTGDMGYIFLKNGQIQPIESERICTPTDKIGNGEPIIEGVRVDPRTGATLGYYVFARGGNGTVDAGSKDYEFVNRDDMIFLTSPIRFDQLRGVPDLAPVVNALQDCKELGDATLNKAKLDAMHAWAIYSDTQTIGNLGARGVDNEQEATRYEKFEEGQNYYLAPGDKVESLASNTPNSQYMPFYELNLRMIGSALGLPYEFLLLDFSKGSYSSSRAALLQTYRTFTGWQEWLSIQFLQRLWNWRIAKAIKAGDIAPAPTDAKGQSQWYKVNWQFPEFGWVDPQKEADADKTEYQMGVSTLSAIVRKKGRDVEDVLAEKANDIATAKRIADEVNTKQPGLDITWRDLINVETVAGQKANEQTAPKEEPKGMEDDNG